MSVYRNSEHFHADGLNFFNFMLQILTQIETRAKLNSIELSDPNFDHQGNRISTNFRQRLLIFKGEPKAIITLATDPASPHHSMFRNGGYVTVPGYATEFHAYAGASMEEAKADLNALLDKTFPEELKTTKPDPLPTLQWFIGIQEPPPCDGDHPQRTWKGTPWEADKVYEAYDHLVSLLAKGSGDETQRPIPKDDPKAVDFPEARGPVFRTVSDDEM